MVSEPSADTNRVDDIVAELLTLPRERREARLVALAGDDETLRHEVRRLLDADSSWIADLDVPVFDHIERWRDQDRLGEPIGDYRLEARLGRGGTATVYLGRRRTGVGPERVAVKILATAVPDDAARRFAREAEILSRLDHPNIASIYGGGVCDDGSPYLVLEYVEGVPLDRWCAERELSIDDRLRLLLPICDAVSHAHAHLVVHRDLKPANILVDARGEPKLLDFGISKCLDPLDAEPQTATAFRMLTPEYASPEQLRFHSATAATDVYALGVVLFELLAGRRPFRQQGDSETLYRAILEDPPPKVSSAARQHLDSGRSERWAKRLAGDLDAILDRSLAKAPEERYLSPRDLARDLERHLDRRPVSARPPTLVYRWGRLVRRRWRELAVAAVLVALLALRIVDAETIRSERDRAMATRDVLVDLLRDASPISYRGDDEPSLRDLLARGVTELDQLDHRPDLQAFLLHLYGDLYVTLGELDTANALLDRALATSEPDDENRVDLLSSIAALRRSQGRPAEAEDLLDRALELHASRGGGVALRFELLQNLGLTRVDQGRFAEAEEPLRRGLETSWRASLPIEDQALALNNLAYSRLLRESYDEALVLLRRSVALRQTALGADHPETAMSLANLATAAHATGHHDEARDVLLEAIESWRRRDPDHPMVALLLGNLGAVEQALGDRRAAERSFVEAADHYERRLGDRHPSTARAWNNLGNLFAETGRLREAQHYLRRAHSVVEDRFGPEHPETLTTLWNLIATEIDAGQARRAEASLVEQLDRSAEDPDFPSSDLEHGVQVVARLLRAEGRHAEAERLVARLAEPENRP